MELDKTCTYVSTEESEFIDCNQMKDKLVKEYLLLLFMANSQDRVKLEAQDHSYQHLSCTSHSLQLQNSQLVKERN